MLPATAPILCRAIHAFASRRRKYGAWRELVGLSTGQIKETLDMSSCPAVTSRGGGDGLE
jgi:hypothetical protein